MEDSAKVALLASCIALTHRTTRPGRPQVSGGAPMVNAALSGGLGGRDSNGRSAKPCGVTRARAYNAVLKGPVGVRAQAVGGRCSPWSPVPRCATSGDLHRQSRHPVSLLAPQ